MNTRPGPHEPTAIADDLSAEWDALLRSELAGNAATGSLITIAHRLHGTDTTPTLTSTQRAHIWQEVLGSTEHGDESLDIANWHVLTGNQATGPRPAPPPRTLIAARQTTRPRWPLAQLGVAALLLLSLGIGYVVLGSGWLPVATQLPQLNAPEFIETHEETRVTSLVGAAASIPGVVDTPLLETSFAAQQLPGDTKTAIYYQLSLDPGVSLPYLGAPLCDCITKIITRGVGAEVVRSGAYTLRLDAPLRVLRTGSTRPSEEVRPGTEITLTPGDAVIYPNYVTTGEVRNAGDEPVSLIGVAIVGADGPSAPLPNVATRYQGHRALLEVGLGTLQPPMPAGARTKLLSNTMASDWAKLPPGPLNVALHDVTVPAGTAIGPYLPLGLEALFVESGTIARGFQQPGKSAPERETLTVLAGSTSPLMAPQASVRTIVASTGDQPAALLALLIEPVPTNARGPAP